jgi:glycosyltransferase involved in cell wall biosynthesis
LPLTQTDPIAAHGPRNSGDPTDGTIHVTHVLAPSDIGGLERVVQALSVVHPGRRVQSSVIAIVENGHPCSFANDVREDGGEVVELTVGARAYLKERALLRAILRTRRPHVVHTHGFRPDVVAASVARSLDIPVVSTVHGFTGGGWRVRMYERLQCRALRNAAAVVAVSTDTSAKLVARGVPASRITVIRNGWAGNESAFLSRDEARALLGLSPEATVIGWVGRMSAEKAPLLLVHALERMAGDAARPIAVFVGDGPQRSAVQRAAEICGMGERVRFAGSVPHAARILRAFDVFALTSTTEGTPIAILEAMAAGVPIVSTAVGGVPDVLGPELAWLVRPDDPEAMAKALSEAVGQRGAAQERASRASERLHKNFSGQAWLSAYENLYREVLARSRC